MGFEGVRIAHEQSPYGYEAQLRNRRVPCQPAAMRKEDGADEASGEHDAVREPCPRTSELAQHEHITVSKQDRIDENHNHGEKVVPAQERMRDKMKVLQHKLCEHKVESGVETEFGRQEAFLKSRHGGELTRFHRGNQVQ